MQFNNSIPWAQPCYPTSYSRDCWDEDDDSYFEELQEYEKKLKNREKYRRQKIAKEKARADPKAYWEKEQARIAKYLGLDENAKPLTPPTADTTVTPAKPVKPVTPVHQQPSPVYDQNGLPPGNVYTPPKSTTETVMEKGKELYDKFQQGKRQRVDKDNRGDTNRPRITNPDVEMLEDGEEDDQSPSEQTQPDVYSAIM